METFWNNKFSILKNQIADQQKIIYYQLLDLLKLHDEKKSWIEKKYEVTGASYAGGDVSFNEVSGENVERVLFLFDCVRGRNLHGTGLHGTDLHGTDLHGSSVDVNFMNSMLEKSDKKNESEIDIEVEKLKKEHAENYTDENYPSEFREMMDEMNSLRSYIDERRKAYQNNVKEYSAACSDECTPQDSAENNVMEPMTEPVAESRKAEEPMAESRELYKLNKLLNMGGKAKAELIEKIYLRAIATVEEKINCGEYAGDLSKEEKDNLINQFADKFMDEYINDQ